MIANIKTDASDTGTQPIALPRTVTITASAPKNGRLPVRVKVVPLADLDAKGGVFIDFRKGTRVVETAERSTPLSISRGDAAVDALAALEAGDQETPSGASNGPELARGKNDKGQKRPIASHQVAPPKKLIIGQEESFSVEVAMPATAPDGQAWFVRARFSTQGGRDLCSAWAAI